MHGLTQDGGIFEPLGEALARRQLSVIAVDLRGHGASRCEPPWDTATHTQDVLETLSHQGVTRATWVGHSYGGRVAASLAATEHQLTEGLVMLETPSQVPAARADRTIKIESLDWSFATIDGAIEAMLASELMVKPPREVVSEFVRRNVRKGMDGRFRYGFSREAAVAAWREMTSPPPPIAQVPTLLVSAEKPLMDNDKRDSRYREELGEMQRIVKVPNGHNVLWEAPSETVASIEAFLGEVV